MFALMFLASAVSFSSTRTAATYQAVDLLVHSQHRPADAVAIVTALGHQTTQAMRKSVDQSLRKDLGWSDVRSFRVKSELDGDAELLLRAAEAPLVIEWNQSYYDRPTSVLMLEQLATRHGDEELRNAALAALQGFYESLGEAMVFATKMSRHAPPERLDEFVMQAMMWLEASDSPGALATLRTIAEEPPRGALASLSQRAGNILIEKAKRNEWLKTALACADILEDAAKK